MEAKLNVFRHTLSRMNKVLEDEQLKWLDTDRSKLREKLSSLSTKLYLFQTLIEDRDWNTLLYVWTSENDSVNNLLRACFRAKPNQTDDRRRSALTRSSLLALWQKFGRTLLTASKE